MSQCLEFQNGIQIQVYNFDSWYNAANQHLRPELPERHSPNLPAKHGSSGTAGILQAVIDPLCPKEAKKVSVTQGSTQQ